MKEIGEITQSVIDLLGLGIPANTPIYIGEENIAHIKSRHPYEFEAFFPHLSEILSDPNYVGYNTKNGSIDYVKLFCISGNYVQVSVRVSGSGRYFARTLFSLMTYKAERFIAQGTLKRL